MSPPLLFFWDYVLVPWFCWLVKAIVRGYWCLTRICSFFICFLLSFSTLGMISLSLPSCKV
uniref:Sodium/hydrogen exchanger 1-like isoform X2 n=1 Tax=Rhizophora mucronata TaxID=61149 RepID=A0A2P2LSH9_RHIMU